MSVVIVVAAVVVAVVVVVVVVAAVIVAVVVAVVGSVVGSFAVVVVADVGTGKHIILWVLLQVLTCICNSEYSLFA